MHKKTNVGYLVRWAGFAAEHDTWKSADYIQVVDAWQGYALRRRRIEAENNRNKKRNAT